MPTIRPARPDDHRLLEALLRRASLATGEHAEDLLDQPDAMDIPVQNLAHTLVAEAAGVIIGFCTILPQSETVAEIEAVFVDPESWRQGLGEQLVSAGAQMAVQAGVVSLDVVSGRYALPFYESLGFERAGLEATRFGPAVRLTKALAASSPSASSA